MFLCVALIKGQKNLCCSPHNVHNFSLQWPLSMRIKKNEKSTIIGALQACNRLFLNCLVPLFQSIRPRAKPFIWKWVLCACEWKLIFIWKAVHQDSLWKRGTRQLGNGLLRFCFFTACLLHITLIMYCNTCYVEAINVAMYNFVLIRPCLIKFIILSVIMVK